MTETSTPHTKTPNQYTQSVDKHDLSDKTLIIFDWDGTLMDSIGLIVDSMHVAGEAHGFKTTDKAVKDIIGLSLMNGIEILYPYADESQTLAIQQTYAESILLIATARHSLSR